MMSWDVTWRMVPWNLSLSKLWDQHAHTHTKRNVICPCSLSIPILQFQRCRLLSLDNICLQVIYDAGCDIQLSNYDVPNLKHQHEGEICVFYVESAPKKLGLVKALPYIFRNFWSKMEIKIIVLGYEYLHINQNSYIFYVKILKSHFGSINANITSLRHRSVVCVKRTFLQQLYQSQSTLMLALSCFYLCPFLCFVLLNY